MSAGDSTAAGRHYSVDLLRLQESCELNYACLSRLLPSMARPGCRLAMRWQAQALGVVSLEVIGASRYTSTIRLRQEQALPWLPVPTLDVRAYHDARMAEVVAVQNSRRLLARYPYPNARMHQPDEKSQLNLFLGEWLRHCLACGNEIEPAV